MYRNFISELNIIIVQKHKKFLFGKFYGITGCLLLRVLVFLRISFSCAKTATEESSSKKDKIGFLIIFALFILDFKKYSIIVPLLLHSFNSRQTFSFQHFQHGTTPGGNIAHFILEVKLFYSCYRISSSYKRESSFFGGLAIDSPTAIVPLANGSISNTPIGPFHKIVSDSFRILS